MDYRNPAEVTEPIVFKTFYSCKSRNFGYDLGERTKPVVVEKFEFEKTELSLLFELLAFSVSQDFEARDNIKVFKKEYSNKNRNFQIEMLNEGIYQKI